VEALFGFITASLRLALVQLWPSLASRSSAFPASPTLLRISTLAQQDNA
jgi:hypothetical protein